MALLDSIAVVVTLTALLAYINHRFVRLPPNIGVMVLALLASLMMVLGSALGFTQIEDQAEAILAVATATAEGLRRVAESVTADGGPEAMQLRIAEQYIDEFGNLARHGNTFVVPANLADLTSMMALATDIAKRKSGDGAGVA